MILTLTLDGRGGRTDADKEGPGEASSCSMGESSRELRKSKEGFMSFWKTNNKYHNVRKSEYDVEVRTWQKQACVHVCSCVCI